MRKVILAAFFFSAVILLAQSQALSQRDLRNLLDRIRQNRATQADFEEVRVIRLMKKPIASQGKVWFQPPDKGSPLDATVAAINSALNLENIEETFAISGTTNGKGYTLELLPRTAA